MIDSGLQLNYCSVFSGGLPQANDSSSSATLSFSLGNEGPANTGAPDPWLQQDTSSQPTWQPDPVSWQLDTTQVAYDNSWQNTYDYNNTWQNTYDYSNYNTYQYSYSN